MFRLPTVKLWLLKNDKNLVLRLPAKSQNGANFRQSRPTPRLAMHNLHITAGPQKMCMTGHMVQTCCLYLTTGYFGAPFSIDSF